MHYEHAGPGHRPTATTQSSGGTNVKVNEERASARMDKLCSQSAFGKCAAALDEAERAADERIGGGTAAEGRQ